MEKLAWPILRIKGEAKTNVVQFDGIESRYTEKAKTTPSSVAA